MNSSVEERDVNVSSCSSSTLSFYSPPYVEESGCSKSPETIQEWVDSIRSNKPDSSVSVANIKYNVDEETELTVDTFHLGAEACHSDVKIKRRQTEAITTDSSSEVKSAVMADRRLSLLLMRDQQASLQSDASSLSSLSSIETILESRREDPEEILLNLGFGGSIEPLDPLARIPKRFLNPSKVRGNYIDQFVRHQEELLETLDSGFCGYRGLSGFLKERHDPAGLVGKLLEKIRVNDRDVRSSSPTCNLTSMSEVAFSILAVNTFRNSLLRKNTLTSSASILDPVNREFLQQQGEGVVGGEGRRRIIVGQDEFRVDGDGGLIHSGKVGNPCAKKNPDDASKITESKTLWNVCRQLKSIDACKGNTNRLLIRQNSICIDSSDDKVCNPEETDSNPSTDNKLATYKESFELEELRSQDGEVDGNNEQDDINDNDVRISSASSDSSGFLEFLANDDNRNDKTDDDEIEVGYAERISPPAPTTTDSNADDNEHVNRFRPIVSAQQFLMIVSDEENKIVCTEGISKEEEVKYSSRSESFVAQKIDYSLEEYKCDIGDCPDLNSVSSSQEGDCPDLNSVSSSQEEDEYNDLQQLLRIIAKEDLVPKLTRREFLSKPVDERIRLECAALEMALHKYQLTLNSERSSLNQYKNWDEMSAEERHELSVLRELRSGICHELAQLQLLLASRMKRVNRTNSSVLSVSMKLIRQFSLLLHQQNSLCRQLEELNDARQNREQFSIAVPGANNGRS